MIKINLLPFRAARRKENIRQQVSIFSLSFVLILVALISWVFLLSSEIGTLNRQITKTKQDLKKYNEINQEIASIQKKLAILNKKISIINVLELNRHEPVKIFDAMTKVVVPKQLWFTSLQSKEKTVDIKGIAMDNKTAAKFMTNLEEIGLFSQVKLKTLKHENLRNINLKSFEISCEKIPIETPELQLSEKTKITQRKKAKK